MTNWPELLKAIEGLLGDSAFAGGIHKLLTNVHADGTATVFDEAVKTAGTLIDSGLSLAATVKQVSDTHTIPEHAAMAVTAAAVASKK